MLSDEEILRLWRDPSFDGSYRGVRTFQAILKTNLNIDIALSRLYRVLSNDEIYLIHKRPEKRIQRRHYYVHSLGELCQMDIAHMFVEKETNFRYFLLFVDVFSSRTLTEPLKTRETPEIISALRKIFLEFNSPIHEIQADRETAFLSKNFKDFLREKHIVYRPKFGKNKGKKMLSLVTSVKLSSPLLLYQY